MILLNCGDVAVSRLYLEGGTLAGDGNRTLTVLESGRWSNATISVAKLKIEPDCTFEFSGEGKSVWWVTLE